MPRSRWDDLLPVMKYLMWQVNAALLEYQENVVCVWRLDSDGRYLEADRRLELHPVLVCAGWLQAVDERQLDDGTDMASVVLRWHSLHSAVQDDPPYCRAFRLPLSKTSPAQGNTPAVPL